MCFRIGSQWAIQRAANISETACLANEIRLPRFVIFASHIFLRSSSRCWLGALLQPKRAQKGFFDRQKKIKNFFRKSSCGWKTDSFPSSRWFCLLYLDSRMTKSKEKLICECVSVSAWRSNENRSVDMLSLPTKKRTKSREKKKCLGKSTETPHTSSSEPKAVDRAREESRDCDVNRLICSWLSISRNECINENKRTSIHHINC